jgi:hypothetical protein
MITAPIVFSILAGEEEFLSALNWRETIQGMPDY